MEKTTYKRLESLDALRGFDLFFLVALGPLAHSLARAADVGWLNDCMWAFNHVQWEGFSPWDLIMPLFLFMSGASMPFALSRFKGVSDKKTLFRRLGKRILLLWIFGMMCQGNLLGFDPDRIYLYSNTLQSIAAGYLITAVLFLYTSRRTQIGVAVALLLVYWAAMQFITVGSYGGGNYTPEGNLAEWIDRTVLGRFRDGAKVVDGEVVFAPWYHYTWILSTLNFGVTVLTGLFAGYIAKDKTSDIHKLKLYFGAGAAMVAAGWLWGLQMPVIKTIWTSSMVLVSSGYCFLLMGLFYYLIDYKGYKKNITWLKVYGMNSIVAYMLANVINFSCLGQSLFYGMEQYLGNYYSFLISLSNVLVIYVILWLLYKRNIFLKV
ncbi:acyltransferase family protein [Parabacteroides goldsteinii]|uniref:acyltransferase family protein n=1 Tax=Parabacteroides goldsteinii TaxID=328812 RepID=UPI0039935AAF